ncbi:TVP38/TMEM64 family protein [Candidatus Dependentiae bacterium Noda2021]|nr:TVP38/TMEM64 family protein [Candidatus Dependentiae bacterium Noda2021]
MHPTIRTRLIIVLIVAALVAIVWHNGFKEHATLSNLQDNIKHLEQFVQTHYLKSVLMYIGAYATEVILVLPLSALLTLTSGFLFGVVPGVAYTIVGATIGATISFLLVRYLFGHILQKKYATQLVAFNAAVEQQGWWYLMMTRFIFVIPFFVINILAGLTKVPLTTFMWTTALGIIPSSFIYAYTGKQLTEINSLRDIFTPKVLLAFIMLGLFAAFPAILNKIRGYFGKQP